MRKLLFDPVLCTEYNKIKTFFKTEKNYKHFEL